MSEIFSASLPAGEHVLGEAQITMSSGSYPNTIGETVPPAVTVSLVTRKLLSYPNATLPLTAPDQVIPVKSAPSYECSSTTPLGSVILCSRPGAQPGQGVRPK